jgi:predicted esterase
MNRLTQFISRLFLFCALLPLAGVGRCALAPGWEKQELVFIYVHGFGEVKKSFAFEAKMNGYLKPLGLRAAATTFRWSDEKLDLTRVVYQWGEAKRRADAAANELGAELDRLEKAKTRYVLVGYSLGCRVVAGALREGAPLKNLIDPHGRKDLLMVK